jgi:hypothetical protein
MPDDPAVFSDAERKILSCVLDVLIPASDDGRFPAAGTLGLGAAVEQVAARTPGLDALVRSGLEALDAAARARGAAGFAAAAPAERRALLEEVAAAQPGFVPALVFHTYTGYYQHPRVFEALGLEPRPPFPRGHELAPVDPALLAPVRRMRPRYRRV